MFKYNFDAESVSDNELLKYWKSGDIHAFDLFFTKHYTHILKIVLKKTNDISIAEDIAQESFLALYLNNSNLIDNPLKYLHIIVRNKVINHYVRNKSKFLITIDNHKLAQNILSHETADTKISLYDLTKQINAIIDQLPNKSRKVFLLSREGNLSNKEIAIKLDISIKTVEYHITKVLDILQKKLNLPQFLLFYIINKTLSVYMYQHILN